VPALAPLPSREGHLREHCFKQDWNRHAKAAPFRRNDQLLSVMPCGLIVFPGWGITENIADKASRLGHPCVAVRGGRRVSAIFLQRKSG